MDMDKNTAPIEAEVRAALREAFNLGLDCAHATERDIATGSNTAGTYQEKLRALTKQTCAAAALADQSSTAGAAKGGITSLEGLPRYRQYGTLMVIDREGEYYFAADVRALLASQAEPAGQTLLNEILALAEQGMCHGLTADDFCSQIVAKIKAASPLSQPHQSVVAAEPEHMNTQSSREYLVTFMEQHFTDKTYHRYIRGDATRNHLAGDFAWQMARALRMLAAAPLPPASAPVVPVGFAWPEPPPSKGQSHVLFEDGYAEGWAKAIDTVRKMVAGAPLPPAPAPVEQPLWDDNGEPWNEAAEEDERHRALPVGQALDLAAPNGGMHASIYVKVWGDAGGGDAGRIALANYAHNIGRNQGLEEAAKACEAERVEDTGTDGDTGYNNAIKHAAAAIRALRSAPVNPVSENGGAQ